MKTNKPTTEFWAVLTMVNVLALITDPSSASR
jgi:hypothetical protein